jgi:demethylmenaquinone methyltransferase/2-methoxy-6-polyprenyl-1,4-benzoquinol methylase
LTGDPGTSPIRQMFSAIAPRYDLLNRILSLGMDQSWRAALARETARQIEGTSAPRRILDLATGTGDVALALDRRLPRDWAIVGADLTLPMLRLAPAKFRRGGARPILLAGADAVALPFRDGVFAAATISFGLRNVPERARALAELARVLAPGGRLLVLEFSPETAPVVGPLARYYLQRVTPWIGGLVSGNRPAYRYLPASVDRFPSPAALAREMEAAGFGQVRHRAFAFGVARLHTGKAP